MVGGSETQTRHGRRGSSGVPGVLQGLARRLQAPLEGQGGRWGVGGLVHSS